MSAAYATFGLAPATRAGGPRTDGGHEVRRDFVDFVVDGSPLLFQLSGPDAVSPLASDVPPAIFTAHVRGLLLESGAPLPGGRHILYGCPECEDLACGAVTAVIERDGDDYVWRDFAWQTGEIADPERNGYHGIGPFRFPGPAYREALGALLDGPVPPPGRRVLLIGARVAILAKLAAALRAHGIGADITGDTEGVPAEELRGYAAVVLGPATGQAERAAVRRAFERAAVEAAFLDAAPPIVPVLVARVEHALDRSPLPLRRLARLTAADGTAAVEVAASCRVTLTAHRLDRLSRPRTQDLFDGVLEPGGHRVPLDGKAAREGTYVVARAAGSVLVAAVTR
ncbi:oxidoreductase [Streptomyces sp. NPDC051014]|uniref:oxidoreductase n=1 Tax=Streptomyces sp. NPDC051014 TaxID=3155751 RepID=UPI00340D80AF